MTFEDCIKECATNKEFVAQFNRLNGTHLFEDKRAPVERMVDSATGYDKVLDEKQREYFHAFVGFVFYCVWLPLAIDSATEQVKRS